MAQELTPFRFPWEPALPPTTEQTVVAIQRDLAYIMRHTAVLVHSENEAFRTLVNTLRGQIVPVGKVKFSDGTTVELQDVGMPQVGAPEMSVRDLMAQVWETAKRLGLELEA